MRKFLLVLICMISFINIYNAECNNSELKKLNTLANYIESSYEFNESTGKFDVIFINVPDELYIVNDFKRYDPSNGIVRVSNVEQGADIKYEVYSSINAECVTQYLRVMRVSVPYLNKFFGTESCNGYENIDECNNKFLNYELTSNILNKRKVEEDIRRNQNKDDDKKNDVNVNPNPSVLDKLTIFTKEYWLPVLLVIVSSSITFIICNIIYRRVKHGI